MRRILLLLALLGSAAAPLGAQQHGSSMEGTAGGSAGQGGGKDHAMMARMDSLGARLDSLTRVMNQASGTRKVDAMAAVLTALVGHHLEMQRHMHEGRMGGGSSGQGEGKGGMDCPKRAGGEAAEPAHNH